ncbi:MAG: MFS transporter [Sphingomonadales bacterium]
MAGAAAPPARPGARDFRPIELIALIFVVCTGFSSQMVMPLWIGAIIDDLSLTQSAAGTVASVEFAAVAVVSIIVALQVQRFKALPTVMVGMALLLSGNLLAAFADSAATLTTWRVMAGCGKGLVVAITFSLAAGTIHPTRTFAMLNGAYALFSMIFYLSVPPFIAMSGASGAFLMMAGVAAVGGVMLFWFPDRPMKASELQKLSLRDVPVFGYVALAALIILWIGHNAVWTFIERLGTRVDLTIGQIGMVLSVSAFLTIGGPALARIIDTRWGHTNPIVLATALKILAVLALVYVPLTWVYASMVPVFLILALFIVPYVMGILSLADPAGRLAAASSAAMTAGGSLGALVGGVTADGLGYTGLAWVSGGHFIVVIVLIAGIATTLKLRGSAAASTAS